VGHPPFEGSSAIVLMHCHMNEPPRRPSDKVEEIPKALDDLVVALMAKAPADRPFDAAAVELVLTQLRDKAQRGANIPMVWPAPGPAAANPPRAGAPGAAASPDSPATERPKKKPRKAGPLATLTSTLFAPRSRSGADEDGAPLLSRGTLELAALLLALLAVGGLIVYLVWPEGQEALYRKAEALMASSHRSDWLRARDEYLEPLERRFPDNPYRDRIRKWRDQILVEDAEGRASYLTAEVPTPFSKPKNRAEGEFQVAHAVVAPAIKRHDEPTAAQEWKKLAAQLDPEDPEERKWHLLALRRAQEVEDSIRDTRLIVEKQLKIADEAFIAGDPDKARTIRDEVVKRYKDYPYLKDLLGAIPTPSAGSPPNPPPTGPDAGKPPAQTPPSGSPEGRPGPAAQEPKPESPKSDQPAAKPDSGPSAEVDQQSRTEFRSYNWTPIDGRPPVG
jgi:serine/threonine-protein kinase